VWETFLAETVPRHIAGQTPITYLVILLGGLVTSLSPCVLSMVPVMVGYIGGYGAPSRTRGFFLSLCLVTGLAVTFGILGITAAALGKVFGQIGKGWYYLMAAVAIIMGLNLLGVFTFRLPGLKSLPVRAGGPAGAFLVGLFFGLVASPCATPVLAVIMTYVAGQGDLVYGGTLLFTYGFGHGMPLVLVGTFTGLLKNLGAVQPFARYIPQASGAILVLLGLYLLMLVS